MDITAFKHAARAAIVMPAVFAFADKVIGQPQVSLFAAFGSFAMLVLVEFEGSLRTRLSAYLGLALVGAAFITLGTLCSQNAWLAAGSMAVVGFVTLFSGVISGYVAAAGTSALLLFVLPVTIVAPASAIPDRLEGWALAAGAGILAQLLLWPPGRQAGLRHDAVVALRTVADLLEANREQVAERARLARTAVDALGRRMLGAQHRPTGPTAATAALVALPDELDYNQVTALSFEVRQKLNQHRPQTLGQATRISGVTPAAISLLLVHLKKKRFKGFTNPASAEHAA